MDRPDDWLARVAGVWLTSGGKALAMRRITGFDQPLGQLLNRLAERTRRRLQSQRQLNPQGRRGGWVAGQCGGEVGRDAKKSLA
jgi:hypothetical protein